MLSELIKDIRVVEEKVKQFLFIEDMIDRKEKEFIDKLFKLLREFSKVVKQIYI